MGLRVDFEGRARIFLDILDARFKRKRGVRCAKLSGLRHWKEEVAIERDGETSVRAVFP